MHNKRLSERRRKIKDEVEARWWKIPSAKDMLVVIRRATMESSDT